MSEPLPDLSSIFKISLSVRIDLTSITRQPIRVSLIERLAIASADRAHAARAILALMTQHGVDDYLLRSLDRDGRRVLFDWALDYVFPDEHTSPLLVEELERIAVKA